MKYKGFLRLSIQMAIMSITMLTISIFTYTHMWLEYFNNLQPEGECNFGNHHYSHEGGYNAHYHWNYRAVVYTITGVVYFLMNCIRIGISHK